MSAVRVLSVTRTTTATHVAAKLVSAMGLFLSELGLAAQWRAYTLWDFVERSLISWMDEGALEWAKLEVFDPKSDEGLAICDFPISYYDESASEQRFLQDLAMATYQARKAKAAMRRDAEFRVLVHTASHATKIEGWSATTARSTAGMTRLSSGVIASGPRASASFQLWVRR